MTENLINTALFAALFLILFGSAEILYHRFRVQGEFTRKYTHLFSGLLTLFFPIYLGNHWMVLLLSSSFFVVLKLSMIYHFLPSINHVNRKTNGSLIFPLVIYFCYFFYDRFDDKILFYVPILVLSFCDPLATIIGKKWPYGRYKIFGHTKTLSGSMAFFVFSILTIILSLMIFEKASFQEVFILACIGGFVTTLAEGTTHKGFDNLTIPLSTIMFLMANKFIF